jgi:hypothetical protein
MAIDAYLPYSLAYKLLIVVELYRVNVVSPVLQESNDSN